MKMENVLIKLNIEIIFNTNLPIGWVFWCFKETIKPEFWTNTLRKSLQTTSALSATSKLCFELPASSFLVCSLILIEYKNTTLREKFSIS